MFSLKKTILPRSGSSGGSSLVIVLASLALLMVLVLGFLASVGTEFQSSKMYANGSSLKLLAQSTVNLVIGQLRVATADPALAWASQPGMIRTYNSQGNPAGYYKLYSDSAMQGSGAFDHTAAANAVPPQWFDQKGVYVDLNQPVTIAGSNYFPILNGDSSDLINFSPTFDNGSGAQTEKALKPITGVVPNISGFWLRKDTPVDSSSVNKAPMPVKWLYVLKDGQIIVPDSTSTNGEVTFNGAGTKPSKSNQIVGRMAYWTDDETAKVNVNTASEGAFWDTPRTYTVQDYYMAMRQPVQGEFQRYPGHPASVSLSSVLGIANSSTPWTPENPVAREEVYAVTPATKKGGSVGGTVDTTPTFGVLPSSVSRLYSTVDEFLFQAVLGGGVRLKNSSLLGANTILDPAAIKKARFFLTANSQAPDVNIFNQPRVSLWPITLDKDSGNQRLSPYDQLISFCSTINNHIFYFQRQDPTSPVNDLPDSASSSTGVNRNRQLLEYLRKLTGQAIPGFGSGTFADKYGDDRQQILVEMFDYIRSTNIQDSSTGATPFASMVPAGSTNSSDPSYNAGIGQVVPIIDNATSVTDSINSRPSHPRGFGRFPTFQQAALVFIGAGDNSPTYNPPLSYVSPVPAPALPNTYLNVPGYNSATFTYPVITAAGVTRVQAAFLMQLFDPSVGPAVTYPWYEIQVDGLDDLKWSNDATSSHGMQFPNTGTVRPHNRLLSTPQSIYGGNIDFRIFTFGRSVPTPATRYPFVTPPTGAKDGYLTTSAALNCPDMSSPQIYFKGGSATVKIFALNKNGVRINPAVQTVNLTFPAATIPVPTTVANSSTGLAVPAPPATDTTGNYSFRSFSNFGTSSTVSATAPGGRFGFSQNVPYIGSRDVVRAIVAQPGDMRLIAPRTEVPVEVYKPLPNAPEAPEYAGSSYSSSSVTMSHMLRYGISLPVYGSVGGKLVDVNYDNYMVLYNLFNGGPKRVNDTDFYGSTGGTTSFRSKDVLVPAPAGVRAAASVPADWDNGMANTQDGPYINKADEGEAGRPSDPNGHPYFELDYGSALPGPTFFSPNRMMPSAGMFGSLPTGVWGNKPWQTLLFRPGPVNHAGLGTSTSTVYPSSPPYSRPPDHLLLDLFNMPVVEPYAISTPLATAGRINMNYLIVPFTYIHRDTGLRAAMKAQMVTAIPSPTPSKLYKTHQNPNGSPSSGNRPADLVVRRNINADLTLSQFQMRFDRGDIFRSASEICSVDLVPAEAVPSLTPAAPTAPITRAKMDAFWAGYPVTGDNLRERPYANLYPLLTTKSNTYTVHYRVQLLKPVSRSSMDTWREGLDQVTGQYRGSQIIERYIDPADSIPDYATENSPDPLSKFYKFRVVSTQQFAP